MNYEQMLIEKEKVKNRLHKCPNTMAYRDTMKYYQRLCNEIAEYERNKGLRK